MRRAIFSLPRRVTCCAALFALTLLFLSPSGATAQQADIGIYSDENRSSCSLSDAGGGLIHAYVVVNSTDGLTGVRFSIPKPDCFNAVWVSESSDFTTIGNSQVDISIATGACKQGPTHVLTIMYQKASSTAACCEMQVKAAQGQAEIQYADCAFVERPLAARSAFINGNETCACAPVPNLPPSAPHNPSPFPGVGNVRTDAALSWESTDPENGPLHYDLYFGTSSNPPLVASSLTESSFAPPSLAAHTLYYWKVVAFDTFNLSAAGPVWSFTTGALVVPPGPVDPSPDDGALNQNRALTLAWSSSAPTPPQSYEVHFGTTMTPPVVATIPAQSRTSYPVADLALDTRYYWSVVSIAGGQRTEGPLWTFKTWTTNPAPSLPGSPQPANQAKHVPTATTLSWVASDPESQALHYDVYFGPDNDPPLFAHATTNHVDVTGLDYFKDYYWRVVVFDSEDAATPGPTWTFRTKGEHPPTVPVLVAPALDSVVSPTAGYLEWSAQDPEGEALNYDVYMGTTTDPPGMVMGFTFSHLDFSNLNLSGGTTYYWRVTAHDPDGFATDGPLWTFQTKTVVPPNPPSDPSPVDGATDVSRFPTLKWKGSDPNNQALRYVVTLGTSQSSGLDYGSESDSLQLSNALEIGTQYYWRVTAINADNGSTAGPWWTFTTPTSNLPPTAPASPDPGDHTSGQGATVMLQWSATDPEGLPLTYTVCFGNKPFPPQVVSHWDRNSFTMYDLKPDQDYYWIIIAHDVDGNSTYSPQWTFHTGGASSGPTIGMYSDASGTSCTLADNAPGLKNIYVFVDGPSTYTGARFAAPKPSCFNATWMFDSSPYVTIGDSQTDVSIGFGMCMDGPLPVMTITYMSAGNTTACCQFQAEAPPATGRLLVTDCSFAELTAVATPLGITSNNACSSCASTGLLHFAATADSCGAGVPHRTTVALDLNSAIITDNASVDIVMSPSLQFIACERGDLTQDWTTFHYVINGNVLSLSASGGSIPAGVTGSFALLTFETDCCEWTSPAELGLTSALGDFQSTRLGNIYLECRYPPNGDVNNDGNLTLVDAQCALESYLYWPISSPGGCGRLGASMRADVNCSESPTPGDAGCIYRQLVDQSCTFCNGDVHAPPVTAPRLELRSIVENQDVVIVLSSGGTHSMNSLGLELTYPKELQFLRVEAPGNDKFAALQSRVVEPGRLRIGGYVNTGTALPGEGDLIAVRFRARTGRLHGSATALRFVDDLAGAADASTPLDVTIGTPVPGLVVLHQNSPNPFNPQTTIRFELPSAMRVQLSIYDVHGRLVRKLIDEQRVEGASTAEWNGRDDRGAVVATGLYFYVLDAGGSRQQRKMLLLK